MSVSTTGQNACKLPVLLHPPVVDVVRADRVLNGKQRRDLVVLQDHLTLGVENEPDIEEAVLKIRMPRLGLRHDESVVLLGDLAEVLGLLPRNVDRTFARELHVIQVQDLIVETLQRALGKGNQSHRQIQARQPGCRLHQVRQMLEVEHDVLALANAAHGGDEADGRIRLDHKGPPEALGRCTLFGVAAKFS